MPALLIASLGPTVLAGCAGGPPLIATSRAAASRECAPFARALTGVALSGAAADWWPRAAGLYPEGITPAVGALLVFARTRRLPSGHVAVVSSVLDSRTVLLTQANWLHGHIGIDQPAQDVSAANDWSAVQVFWPPTGRMGQTIYLAYGFILPRSRPSHAQIVHRAALLAAP